MTPSVVASAAEMWPKSAGAFSCVQRVRAAPKMGRGCGLVLERGVELRDGGGIGVGAGEKQDGVGGAMAECVEFVLIVIGESAGDGVRDAAAGGEVIV